MSHFDNRNPDGGGAACALTGDGGSLRGGWSLRQPDGELGPAGH